MSRQTPIDEREQQLDEAVASYLTAAERRGTPDRQTWLARYPNLAAELNECFDAQDRIQQTVAPVRHDPEATLLPVPSDANADTLVGPADGAHAAGLQIDEPQVDAAQRIAVPHFAVVPGRRTFGEYELLAEIARGGMGVVFKARQTRLNRTVALKMILAGQFADQEEVRRFRAEAEAAAGLNHPGIVPVYESGEIDGQQFFSMGFVDGESLATTLANGPLAARRAAELLAEVADAVAHAHAQQVIHRDLKPANILLDKDGHPRVTDFGLAKRVTGDSGLTRTGQALGTPSYMPPEQAAGKLDEVGPASDVYALGAVLYAMLTGRPPFQSASPLDTLLQVMEQEPVAPRDLNAKVPRDLETITLKCLEKEARKRYPTAAAVAAELRRFLAGKPIEARPVGRFERGWRWCRRNPVVAGLSATAAALLVMVAVVASVGYRRTTLALADADAERSIAVAARADEAAQRKAAIRQRDAASLSLYLSDMLLAREAWESGAPARVRELIDRHEKEPGGADFRGWEWDYLRARYQGTVFLRGHASLPIVSLAWDSHSPRLASAANQLFKVGQLHLWDTSTGKQLCSLRGHSADVRCLAWSPAGRRLASGGGAGYQQPGELKIWDVDSQGNPTDLPGHEGYVLALAWSADGRRLASAGEGGEVRVWTATGKGLLRLAGHHKHDNVNAAAWRPDGRQLATAANNVIKLWDADSGEVVKTFAGHQTAINRLAWAADGRHLASSAFSGDTIKVWDATNGTESLSVPAASAVSWGWSADGDRLVVVDPHTVRFHDAATGRELRNIETRVPSVVEAAVDGDQRRLALASMDSTITIHDVEQVTRHRSLPAGKGPVAALAWSPDGGQLAAGSDAISLWEPTRNRVKTLAADPDGAVLSIAFRPDGQALLSTGTRQKDGILRLWQANTGEERPAWAGHPLPVFSVAWQPGGRQFASASADGTVKLWDVRTLRELRTLTGHAGDVYCVAWRADGRRLASASQDGTVKLWNAADGRELRMLRGDGGLRTVAFNPDGHWVAAAGEEGVVRVWDAHTGKEIQRLRGHAGPVRALAWTPPSQTRRQRIASASEDQTVKLWDVAAAHETLTLRDTPTARLSVAFSPDGSHLASGGADGQLAIWEAPRAERASP